MAGAAERGGPGREAVGAAEVAGGAGCALADRGGAVPVARTSVQRAAGAFRNFRDAQVFALVPAAIRGLGQSNGFTLELQNTSGMSRTDFVAARDRLLAAANADPDLQA
ncbi:hypothetical protein, partial [Staphylococcus aureus]|uniref:hypothetical protein n=1 Tax=Staphylococcus aureus TaxID=1280 RepID=UPI00190F4D14